MRTLLILSLAMALGHSAPVGTNVDSTNSEEERDAKQLLTLAEFRKKVGQVIGEELTKVINGAFTIPPPTTEAARVTEAAPVTEEQTIIVYITEPPPAPEESVPQTAAPEVAPVPNSQPASEVQPVPSSPPAAVVTSAPVETVSEVAATELVQEVSTELAAEATTLEDEDEEETEATESVTNDPEVASAASVTEAAATNIPVETNEATVNVEVEEGSTLYDVSTLPPPIIVEKQVDTTEDDERDGAFTFPPIATVSGSIVEEAFESVQSTEPVPIGSSTAASSGNAVDEDDDDNEEDEDEYELEYEEVEDGDNRTAKKKVIKKVLIKKKNPSKNGIVKTVPIKKVP